MIDKVKEFMQNTITELESDILNYELDTNLLNSESIEQLGFKYYSELLALRVSQTFLGEIEKIEKERAGGEGF